MVSIICKSSFLSGQYADLSSVFFANQDFSLVEIKGRAATQMHRSNTSSEISFHGLPNKSKLPSIKKQIVVIITVNIIIAFYETVICREIFSKHFFASIFVNF